MAIIPLSVEAQATENYLWIDFSSPGTTLTTCYAISNLHMRNATAGAITVSLYMSDGVGGDQLFDKITLAAGADWVNSYFPFMRMQGSQLKVLHSAAGTPSGLSVSLSFVSLAQLRL